MQPLCGSRRRSPTAEASEDQKHGGHHEDARISRSDVHLACRHVCSPAIVLKEGCCEGCSKTAIPWERVQRVERTPNVCKRKAIVVTTVCGKRFCIQANWKWSKTLLTEFERLSANKTLVPPPFNQTRCSKDVQVV
uniref:uncharacterized protein LOC131132370 isoform X3 n=1 Tax=Doryrhamphus excisus TaxID=161450 RepID=UPI0025AEADC9|nr:uncharacterized protein LOC131132370 isoform X3 [Doryrhamphus excisus]